MQSNSLAQFPLHYLFKVVMFYMQTYTVSTFVQWYFYGAICSNLCNVSLLYAVLWSVWSIKYKNKIEQQPEWWTSKSLEFCIKIHYIPFLFKKQINHQWIYSQRKICVEILIDIIKGSSPTTFVMTMLSWKYPKFNLKSI